MGAPFKCRRRGCTNDHDWSEIIGRFSAKINKTKSCWLWTGALQKQGYGQFSVHQRPVRPHHFSWEMHKGPIPSGLFVLHICDVRNCVRPSHLFVGTQADNMRDMRNKGRMSPPPIRRGSDNNKSRLSLKAVTFIRNNANRKKMTQTALAKKFGVGKTSIYNVLTRKTWSHV